MLRFLRILTAFVLLLTVGSVFGYAQGLRDVKAPVAYPSYLPVLIVLVVIVFLGAAALYLWHWRKRKKQVTPEVVVQPWEKALKQLEELEEENLLVKEYYDQYYSSLSDILRRYIEEQIHIRAPEMTTEEFLQFLKTSADLNPTQKEALKDFLESCDLVKFAKYAPDPSEAKHSFELAKQFIEQTRPKEPVME